MYYNGCSYHFLITKIKIQIRGTLYMSIIGESIRNIAVIGHSGEGKTTLCEAMLFNGGAVDRQGKVADGTTVTDFDELEKSKKMSIYTACAYLHWKGTKINLLDLPGFYDFEGERHEGLRAASRRTPRHRSERRPSHRRGKRSRLLPETGKAAHHLHKRHG